MEIDFNKEQKLIRTSAREFLQAEFPKDIVRELEESDEGYSAELWQKMAELGWMAMNIPEEYGGMEMDFLDLVLLLEEIGYNLLPSPFFSTVMGSFPIIYGGTKDQKAKYLSDIAEGKVILSLAITEPTAKFNPSGIIVKAVPDGDDYIVNGTKLFVENAHIADFLICAARTKEEGRPEDGISIFIVDSKSPGMTVSIVLTIGLDKQCEVAFENTRIPGTNILGGQDKGWEMLKRTLKMAQVGKCAEMVGGIRASLDITNAHVKKRITYERPLASYQVIQHYLSNMWIDMESSKYITYMAAWKINEDLPCAKEVSAAKAWVGKAFTRVTERSIQMHGAIGVTREHDIGLYYRNAKACNLAFGDSGYQRGIMAKEMNFNT